MIEILVLGVERVVDLEVFGASYVQVFRNGKVTEYLYIAFEETRKTARYVHPYAVDGVETGGHDAFTELQAARGFDCIATSAIIGDVKKAWPSDKTCHTSSEREWNRKPEGRVSGAIASQGRVVRHPGEQSRRRYGDGIPSRCDCEVWPRDYRQVARQQVDGSDYL